MKRRIYTRAEREAILNLYDNQCQNCGSTKNLQIHHIVPIGNGGNETLGNMTVLCVECHIKAHKSLNNHGGVGNGCGRKQNKRCDDWEDVIVAYARSELSTSEAKVLLNMSQKSHIKDKNSRFVQRALNDNGIIDYSNEIDFYECRRINKKLCDGDRVGYIVYTNGQQEESLYDSHKREKWQNRVNQILQGNNLAERASAMIAEARMNN